VPHAYKPTGKAKTASHYKEGDKVYHKAKGVGVIKRHPNGQLYPQFEEVMGTPYTRVYPYDTGSTHTGTLPDGTQVRVHTYGKLKEG
jgi:hypothetical protein